MFNLSQVRKKYRYFPHILHSLKYRLTRFARVLLNSISQLSSIASGVTYCQKYLGLFFLINIIVLLLDCSILTTGSILNNPKLEKQMLKSKFHLD